MLYNKLNRRNYMKKLVLLCLAPALLFTACSKQGSQVKRFNGAAVENNYNAVVGRVHFNISSRLGAEYVEIYFAIENEGTKSAEYTFTDSYLQIEGEEQQYPLTFISDEYIRVRKGDIDYNHVVVKADTSEVMVGMTNDLGSATLEYRTVLFHTVLNNQIHFTVTNLCEDAR